MVPNFSSFQFPVSVFGRGSAHVMIKLIGKKDIVRLFLLFFYQSELVFFVLLLYMAAEVVKGVSVGRLGL